MRSSTTGVCTQAGETAPWSGQLQEYGEYVVASYPSICPSVNPLFSNLRCLRTVLGHHLVDYKPCTVNAAGGCFLFAYHVDDGDVVKTGHCLSSDEDYMHWDDEQHVFDMRDALQSNFSLLQHARRFAVPPSSNSKTVAGAFDKAHEWQVCKMGPQSGRLPEPGPYMVDSYPSLYPSVNQLFSNLCGMRSILRHRRVDLDKSCMASAVHGCFHLAELTRWNNFLWVINIELRQGWLALACMCGRVVPFASNLQRRRSFILVHWPEMQQRSTEFAELRESRRRPNQFWDGLSVSRNLRHARLCYHMLDYAPRDLMDAHSSTVTTLDTLEIVSVRFSSVGLSLLCELRDRCEAMSKAVFLEN
ncbi:hypothetical protein HPB49_003206 [Dermacentor silvarum]|uniref:Uncharacterized protein n=1 Tax=Dermacentor silvarum TaxID=543639 RepID=A0ACB8DTU5_DERSI|nr:hypothetical protein HPB49_003206 [Dermacentor silvarum]